PLVSHCPPARHRHSLFHHPSDSKPPERAMLPLLLLPFLPLLARCQQPEDIIPTPYPAFRDPLPGDELLMVQVVWRHGDRAPTMTFPTDPHKESAWNYGWGELTELGMRQQYALGRVIRNRYINGTYHFLSRRYTPREIYIRSTDVNRTLISAYSNIAGMFSEGRKGMDYPSHEKWPTSWTPVPVHTMVQDDDYEGNVFAPCPRANEITDQLKASAEYRKLFTENEGLLNFLSEKTGMTVNLDNVYLVNDALFIERIYNMTLPSWFTPEIAEPLLNLTREANQFLYGIGKPYSPELIKLRGGSMLKSINDIFRHKLSCYTKENQGENCEWMGPLKYYAYSAHDTTVAALLSTFGDERRVIRGGLPHYTASVALELWNLEDIGPAVKILFHGAFHHNYHTITHLTKGCPTGDEYCPFKTFTARSARFEPKNIRKECKARIPLENNRVPEF
ncbi:hypothetical protein PFISCL1PPCAC_7630, partial [Pristionchus fissidentatus]